MEQDRYSQWLGIEAGARPPDHYSLLGIERFCNDADLIDTAAHERLDLLDRYSLAGSRESRDSCQEMMNKVARARVVLMNPKRRGEYNLQLGGQVAPVPDRPERDADEPSQEALDSYKEIVWGHLRKWRMDVHEERLLIAEAASLGINAETALIIARRINSQAEHIARTRQMRTAFGAIFAACVVLTGVVLFFMFPPYGDPVQPQLDDTLTVDSHSGPPAVSNRPTLPVTTTPDPKAGKVENIEAVIVPATRPAVLATVDKPEIRVVPPISIDDLKPTTRPTTKPKPPPEIAATKPAVPVAKDWPFDSAQALGRRKAAAREYSIEENLVLSLGPGRNLALILIPPGEFLMGSPSSEESREKDEQLHAVNISKPFYMGITEVTQAQWKAVMSTSPWSGEANGSNGATLPASYIDWEDAEDFCKWVSEKTGRKVRLPSEAQWEYACRAGSDEAYCFGDDRAQLGRYAWYSDSTGTIKGSNRVLTKKPNAFGLHDMHGNVAEWCRDRYDRDFYEKSPRVDPVHTTPYSSGGVGVYRGGSFLFANACRSAERQSGIVPRGSTQTKHLGFRVIAEIDKPAAAASTTGAKYTTEPAVAKVYAVWPFSSTEAKQRQEETARTLGIKPVVTLSPRKKSGEMTFALIPAGEFVMGSPANETGRREDEVQHKVQITKPFYMSTTEVTEAQWLGVIGLSFSLGRKRPDNLPVHKVLWSDADRFCKVLKGKTSLHFQLPTEAQWEYACRAGSEGAFCFGDDLKELPSHATYRPPGVSGIDGAKMTEVAQKQPNAFGLYDMHGNAYELCRDYYDPRYYSRSPKANPENRIAQSDRYPPCVMRGGSWITEARLCRSSARSVFYRARRSDAGFRVIFSLPDKAKLSSPMFKAAASRQ